ncbi:MAG: hypothetical protein WCL39_01200 [Armatimonadota bacterium]
MILIALCLFPSLVSTPVHAVQLEAGWTAQFSIGDLRGTNEIGDWGGTWVPVSLTGQFGPLDVEPNPWPVSFGRLVTVTHAAEVGTGPLWEDRGTIPDFFLYYQTVSISWYTNYDAGRLRLQLIDQTQYGSGVVWEQKISGPAIGRTNLSIILLAPTDHLVVRLSVVPELPGWMVLGSFAACLLLSRTCARNILSDKGSLP